MSRRNPWPKCPGIYSITLIGSEDPGRRYIGHATDLRYRLTRHRRDLRKGNHFSRHLQNCWNCYGESAFRLETMETCLGAHEILLAREQHWVDQFPGRVFNVRLVVESTKGCKLDLSDENRTKRREQAYRMLRDHPRPKRTNNSFEEEHIPVIFARYAAGEGVKALARDFKVHVPTICDVINRKTWDDIQVDPEIVAICQARIGNMGRKLSDADVESIKRRFAAGESRKAIGLDHGVSGTVVRFIARGDHYGHVRLDKETENAIAARLESASHKTTDETAATVLYRIAAGESQADIARSLGMSQQTVCAIKKGRIFKHVLEAFRVEQANPLPLFPDDD